MAVGILLLTTRIWGEGQSFPVFQHSFFEGTAPLIITKVANLEEAKAAAKLRPDVILWIDVRFSREKTPFVLPPTRDAEFLNLKRQEQEKNPSTPIMIGGRVAEYPWDSIKEFYKDTATLNDFYIQFPTNRFILNVVDNVSEAHAVLVETLKPLKPNQRTLIQSEALIIMTTVKELKPEWVYGTSTPDLMRLMTFESLWILPSTQFKGDVFIAPFKIQKRPAFSEDIITEMRRRQKRIFLGPIDSEEQFAKASRLKADGLITENLPELLRFLGQGPAQ